MKTALYIGNHRGDTLKVRAGWAITRAFQPGAVPFKRFTHTEVIHDELTDGSVVIASSSIRDKGVRTKTARLTHGNWIIVDVPSWSVNQSKDWFVEHNGERYDLRGALATVLLIGHQADRWFCTEADLASVGFQEPQLFGPSLYGSIAMSLGANITTDFFRSRA